MLESWALIGQKIKLGYFKSDFVLWEPDSPLRMLKWSESGSRSVVSNSLQPHELYPAGLLCPWNSPGKNTGMGNHFLGQLTMLMRS